MKFNLTFGVVLALAVFSNLAAAEPQTVVSPDGRLELVFTLDDQGVPRYRLTRGGETVIAPSVIGYEGYDRDGNPLDLKAGFRLLGAETSASDTTWRPVWGEETQIRDRHRELVVHLAKGEVRMDIRFRVFDDGMGLRSEFPRDFAYRVTEEVTEFALTGDHFIWWTPGDYETQEYDYQSCRLSEIEAVSKRGFDLSGWMKPIGPRTVQTPALLKTDSGLYIHLHEAACSDCSALNLELKGDDRTFRAHLVPDPEGVKCRIHAPRVMPWRTVIVSDKATDILASRITLNLNEPCAIADTSWIRPVKYIGVWWEMMAMGRDWKYTDADIEVQIGKTDYTKLPPNGRHAANTENVKRYIDFAAENGFGGVLVEGWNEGWEDGRSDRERVYSFLRPYPDYDLEELAAYSRAKGVPIVMHHETQGCPIPYEREIDEAFKLMQRLGSKAVKTGYVGFPQPFGYYHSSQWMSRHYQFVIEKAAAQQLLVNGHEAVRPTGLCRTWPNMIGNESARGTEFESFGHINPRHTTLLPFLRLVGGPMDYTPGILETDLSLANPGKPRHISSTVCRQLALYVTLYSPMPMAADHPDHYRRYPELFEFIRRVPCEWERSVYVEAEPGEFVTIARQEKGGDDWYLGCTAGNSGHQAELKLGFLTPDRVYHAKIWRDGDDAAYDRNPKSYVIEERDVTAADTLKLCAGVGGGFAVEFKAK